MSGKLQDLRGERLLAREGKKLSRQPCGAVGIGAICWMSS
jgi:hypothetical protein